MKFNPLIRATVGGVGLAALLTACGGGGGSFGGQDLSVEGQVSTSVTPNGTVTVQAGGRVDISANASAKYANVTSQSWTISQTGGNGGPAPRIVDAACSGATTTPGNLPKDTALARDGTSVCQTSITVPADALTGEWLVENVAKSTTKGSASDRFTLKVNAVTVPDSGFALSIPSLPMAFELGKTASLSASYTANVGVSFDVPVTYEWTQMSGDVVALAGAHTNRMSFIARKAGDYVFRVKATAVVAGKTIVREGAVVAVIEAPQAVLTYQVSAGALQAVQSGNSVTMTGVVTGDVPAKELSYRWTQVSGPAATLFGETSLTPQFSARQDGDYVFELAVTRQGATPVVKTARTQVSVYTPQVAQPFFTVSAGDVQSAAPGTTIQLKAQVVNGTPAPTNLTYNWVQRSGPTVTLSSANTLTASFLATTAGTYEFDFTATTGSVSKSGSTVVVVTAPPAGYFSVAAGVLQVAAIDTNVSLAGAVNGTVPTQDLAFSWMQVSGPQVTLFGGSSLTPQFRPTVKGEYVFELFVRRKDDYTTVQSAQTMVSVYSPADTTDNPFFAVSAGDIQIVSPTTSPILLNGTVASGTPAPGNLVYKWTQLSGPALDLIANDKTLRASFVPKEPGLYVFELAATAGNVTKTSVTSVQVLGIPVFSVSAGDIQTVPFTQSSIVLTGTVTAGTTTPTNLTYLWTQVSGPALDALANEKTARATFAPSAPGLYVFELKVVSGDITKTATTSVRVTP